MDEIWKDVEGYEGIYQVSNLGRIKSLARSFNHLNRWGNIQSHSLPERELKISELHDHYQSVVLSKNGKSRDYFVHRLVAQAFIPNPYNLPQVNHKDENPSNNCVDNLEWCTPLYNSNYGNRRDKLSKALKGKPFSKERREKMKQDRKGEGNPMYGRTQSEETKHKMSLASKGVKKSPEHAAKIRERMIGTTPWNKGKHSRPITCLDANIEFECSQYAADWIGNGITSSAIEYSAKRIACCKGHVFVYSDNIPEDVDKYIKECLENYRKGSKSGRPCKCVEDGKIFKCISEAAKYYGLTYGVVSGKLDSSKGVMISDGRVVHFARISFEEFDKMNKASIR